MENLTNGDTENASDKCVCCVEKDQIIKKY